MSVGRIFRGLYNDKRYDVLTEAFRHAHRSELSGWEYHIAGSLSADPETEKFYEGLRRENEGFPVIFHVNEPYDSLVRLYNEASIFWHAAGYGVDETKHPENVEHFGMTTVEAMSAGSLPVVIDKGGQREIISHGMNGFLWRGTDELISQTADIIRGKVPIEDVRRQARERYRDFDLEHFERRTLELTKPYLV